MRRLTVAVAAMLALVALGLALQRPVNGTDAGVTTRARVSGSTSKHPSAVSAAQQRRITRSYGKLPPAFVRNAGQMDSSVAYYGRGAGYGFYFTDREAVLALAKGKRQTMLNLRFIGARTRPTAAAPMQGTVNYVRPGRHASLPTYAEVVYRNLWPNIDMVFRGRRGSLQYEFVLRPGARASDIRLGYAGAHGLSLSRGGGLNIRTSLGVLQDRAPKTWQTIHGRRVPVISRFSLRGGNGFGFDLGRYDRGRPVVIDPALAYSTFLGGAGADESLGIAVDPAGSAYVTGDTASTDFPTTAGAQQVSHNGGSRDAFVSKLNASGTALVYSTFLGGSGADYGYSVAVGPDGAAYVAGVTDSADFPTTSGAFDTSPNGGTDAFLAKLNPTGSGLSYATMLGSPGADQAYEVVVDGTGNAYLTGTTDSSSFPTTAGAYDTSHNGGKDAWVAEVNASGASLGFSTFLGGAGDDEGYSIARDATGLFVTGQTTSPSFPTTAGAYDRSYNGGAHDSYVAKLNNSGTSLAYSTFLGSTGDEYGASIAVDAQGSAYVAGSTFSPNFPTSAGAFKIAYGGNGNSDAFVTKLSPSGGALDYSTFIGGTAPDTARRIAVTPTGVAYVTGWTDSNEMLTSTDGYDTTLASNGDAFVVRLNTTGTHLDYGSFIGGNGADLGIGVAVDPAGDVYVSGRTTSTDLPTSAGAFDTSANGTYDGFVTKLHPPPPSSDGRIAFARGQTGYQPSIWTVNPDGTDLKRLTAYGPGNYDTSPVWSPDGTKIVFNASGFTDVMNADGTGRKRLSPDGFSTYSSASWSPDGTQIAFAGHGPQDPPGDNDIYIVGIDGGGLRKLVGDEPKLTADDRGGDSGDSNPIWSPDGRTIAFGSDYGWWLADVGTDYSCPEPQRTLDPTSCARPQFIEGTRAGLDGVAPRDWLPDGRIVGSPSCAEPPPAPPANGQYVCVGSQDGTGNAHSPADYASTTGSVAFAPGETDKTVSVPVNGNTTDQQDRAFSLGLSNVTGADLAKAQGRGTIIDEEFPPPIPGAFYVHPKELTTVPGIAISDTAVVEGDSGTTNATFTVTLSRPAASQVKVGYSTQPGTATSQSDFLRTTGTVTFAPGETSKPITVAVQGDTQNEPNETFLVNLEPIATNASVSDGQGTGVIVDDDGAHPAALMVQDVTLEEGDSGTTNAVFHVKRLGPTSGSVSADYGTSDGTLERRLTDYVPGDCNTNYWGSFSPDATRVVYQSCRGGTPDRIWTVSQQGNTGFTQVTDPGSGRADQTPDWGPTPPAQQRDLALAMSDSADPVRTGQQLTYTLTARNNSSQAATGVSVVDHVPPGVTFGSATPSQGSCSRSGDTLTCDLGTLGGGNSATIQVQVTATTPGTLDNRALVKGAEADPEFGNDTVREQTVAVDQSVDAGISMTDAPHSAYLDDEINYTLTARNNSATSRALGVRITDTLPSNATFESASPSQGSCPPDPTGNTLACDLGVLEPGGKATIAIVVKPQGAGTLPNTASVSLASIHSDPNSANDTATVQTTVAGSPHASSRIAFVRRDIGGTSDIWTVNPDGTDPANLTNSSGEMDEEPTFSPDGTKIAFSSSKAPGGIWVMNADGTNPVHVSSTSNDAASSPAWSPDGTQIAYSGHTPADQPNDANIYIVNADGTGVRRMTGDEPRLHPDGRAGTDTDSFPIWSPDGRTIAFDSTGGWWLLDVNTDYSCPGPCNRPQLIEGTRIFSWGVYPKDWLPDGRIVGSPYCLEPPPVPSPSSSHLCVGSQDGARNAYSPTDYASRSGNVTFAPGETDKTVSVPVNGNTTDQSNRAFSLDLSNVAGADQAKAQGRGTIIDEEFPQPVGGLFQVSPSELTTVPGIAISDTSVVEGDSGTTNATFTVTLSRPAASQVKVGYSTQSGTATSQSDFLRTTGTVTFAPGETSKPVTVAVKGDTQNEPNETFLVNLEPIATNASVSDAQGTGVIVDDDGAHPPALMVEDVTLEEGNSGTTNAVFHVKRLGPTSGSVSADYATNDGTLERRLTEDRQGACNTYDNPSWSPDGTRVTFDTCRANSDLPRQIMTVRQEGNTGFKQVTDVRPFNYVGIGTADTNPDWGSPPVTAPPSFVVTNTSTSGPGSLRQAILDANANAGKDRITFNIPGAGSHTIDLTMLLPRITQPVIVDGTSQPGYAGAPLVELNGAAAAQGPDTGGGFFGFDAGTSAPNTVIQGLAINRFSTAGILLESNYGVVRANYIGTDVTGTLARPNVIGVEVHIGSVIGGTQAGDRNVISGNSRDGVTSNSYSLIQGNYIGTNASGTAAVPNGRYGIDLGAFSNVGGTAPGARNVISGNGAEGIHSSGDNVIQGNYIGTDASGLQALGNADGITGSGGTVVVGGTSVRARNVISGNRGNGVTCCGTTSILGNYIGVDATGTGALGNGLSGVRAAGYADSTIGGAAAGAGNTIAFNGAGGVTVVSAGRVAILGNSVYSNTGLGIDLENDGVTPNDASDGDVGVNGRQNFPVIGTVATSGPDTTIGGTLQSQPNRTYRLDFFTGDRCDRSGNGEGKTPVGSMDVATDITGRADFVKTFGAIPAGNFVTSTATDYTAHETSEFSACAPPPDLTPPDTTITSGPSDPTNSTSATFAFTSNESSAEFECKLDSGSFRACSSPQSYTGLADGSHTFTVVAIDRDGNADPTPATQTWTVDTAPPDTTISSGPPSLTASASATFGFTATEAGSTFECKLDSQSFQTCPSPTTYSGLADGSHTFQVRAVDPAGNRDPTPATQTWTIDTTPPDTSIDSGPSGTVATQDAAFTFSATEAGSTLQCKLDGGAYATCASPKTYANLRAGTHTFTVRATDPAGNTDPTPAARAWTIDVPANGKIAFLSNRSGGSFVWTMAPDGSNPAQLAGVQNVTALDWSPDGQRIAYASNGQISVMNFDGTGSVALTNTFSPVNRDPDWSPDGSKIAFESAGNVFVMNADGSGQTQLTTSGADGAPSWSPDGTQIAFSSGRTPGPNYDIWVMNADGSAQTRLTTSSADELNPDWSPDGEKIAFSKSFGRAEIAVMNPDGTGVTTLTSNTFEDLLPVWSPDSQKIAFQSNRDGDTEVYSMNADGSAQTDLTNVHGFSSDTAPAWQSAADVPPNTIITSGPASVTTATSATFAFKASKAGATFQCKLDGGSYAPCTSPQPYSGLGEGSHTFSVKAVLNGVEDPTPATMTWTVDRTPPDTTIDSGPSGAVTVRDATFTFSSSESGSTFQCQLDSGGFSPCASPKTYLSLANGNHTFDVRAIDGAGNVDPSPASRTWRVRLPNGKIAYQQESGGIFDIWTANPDGTSATNLTNTRSAQEQSPVWSPDGSKIAFRSDQDGNLEIYTMNADGTAPTRLTTDPGLDAGPTWSPDGSKIAFWSTHDGNRQIYVMNSDGSGRTRLTNNTATDEDPSWSPDGSRIAFESNRDGNPEIYVINADGTGPATRLTNNAANDYEPKWSPDGTKLAFYTNRDVNYEVYTMNADGTGQANITGNGASDTEPAWSPDGTKIVFSSDRVGRTTEIWTANADGTAATILHSVGSRQGQPDWQPLDDVFPPQTTITSGPSSSSGPSVSFSFSSSEAGSSFECKIDSASYTNCSSPQPYSNLAEGSHTFSVRATDAAGNTDPTPATRTWTVDSTPPDTTITGGPSGTSGPSVTFSFSSSEAGSSFECKIDSASYTNCSSPQPYINLADGSHTFSVRATDAAGNTDPTPATRSWNVDATPPDTLIDAGPANPSNSTSATFAFSSSESGSTFECKLDAQSYQPCSSPQTYSSLAEGSHTFSVRAKDAAGNLDPTPATRTWTVDTTAPDTTITSTGPASPTNSTSASFSFSSTEPGSTFECKLDAQSFGPCSSPQSYSSLAEGSHTFSVRATDAAGNLDQSPATRTWTVDTTAPDTRIDSGPPADDPSTTATFTFSSTESGSTFQCQLDGGGFAACTSPTSYTNLSFAAHTFDVRATDAAGNQDPTAASRTWTVRPGYPRPKGATPILISLVPAFAPCSSSNRGHGAPLAYPSCNPPVQESGQLTIGAPDANGVGANSVGSVLYRVQTNDVEFSANISDVRRKATLADYTGELQVDASTRITDHLNGPAQNEAATGQITHFPVTVPCVATSATNVGSTCSLNTTFNAVTPGAIVASQRAVWELGQVTVYDGGPDGVASTAPNTVFMRQGVFVP